MKNKFFNTGRVTGLFYFGLAITGMAAFLFARKELMVSGDGAMTTRNLIEQEALARFGIAMELGLVAFQALTALWFYKLFRKVDQFAAMSLLIFGMVNTTLILIANGVWLEALVIAIKGNNETLIVQTLFEVHDQIWEVGKLFFGLWLIPMGYLVGKAKMPKILSWILIAGGVGYMISAFLGILFPGISGAVLETLTVPATIGEFWIIGYLLAKKVKVKD